MSFWRKNYRTSIEGDDEQALSREYVYYDPIDTLPEAGQRWWSENTDVVGAHEAALVGAGASRAASATQLA
ncbi:MAG: lysine 2,3-aminomutase, partial [Dermatophilaceae bacterium]